MTIADKVLHSIEGANDEQSLKRVFADNALLISHSEDLGNAYRQKMIRLKMPHLNRLPKCDVQKGESDPCDLF